LQAAPNSSQTPSTILLHVLYKLDLPSITQSFVGEQVPPKCVHAPGVDDKQLKCAAAPT
jgi:hypothetical protein